MGVLAALQMALWSAEVASATDDVFMIKSPFSIIIDGGSTGSRLHIFEFVETDSGEEDCVRRGSERSHTPLSAYGRLDGDDAPLNATYVAEHMLPLFEYAADIVPEEYHAITPVKYQATAGMRLLEVEEQEAVYDALYEGLLETETFVFSSTERSDIQTLSGELEGFFGAVAANYLKGVIDSRMRTIEGAEHDTAAHGPLGALDMGGSSTQIVYMPVGDNKCERIPDADDGSEETTCDATLDRLNGNEFFSNSYLAYGVDQFRERLWDTWVEDRIREDAELVEDSCSTKLIDNPCANVGYELEWKGFTLVGTGSAEACVSQVQRLIPHHEDAVPSLDGKHVVGGVEHPPIRGKFYAMSLYFFSLDSLRVLSEPDEDAHSALNLSWPTPSIEELYNALHGLCSRDWKDDLETIQHNAHSFTRAEVLPHRCLESVYMVTLLRDGYGFHPESRDITFSFLVDGSEVEWTLGMVLAMNAEFYERMEQDEAQNDVQSTSNWTMDDGDDKGDSITRHNSIVSPNENELCDGVTCYTVESSM